VQIASAIFCASDLGMADKLFPHRDANFNFIFHSKVTDRFFTASEIASRSFAAEVVAGSSHAFDVAANFFAAEYLFQAE